MDPNLFHLDWERTFEAITAIIVLAFILERALAPLFEHRWFVRRFDESGLKEPIAFALSAGVCWWRDFDALSIIILAEKTSLIGVLITGAVIAGGSKASVKLFHDLLGVQSDAVKAKKERDAARNARPDTVVAP